MMCSGQSWLVIVCVVSGCDGSGVEPVASVVGSPVI
jgi:hypothetical protein